MPIVPLEELLENETLYGRATLPMTKGEKGDEPTLDTDAPDNELSALEQYGDWAVSPVRGVAGAAEEILELPNILGFDYDIPDNIWLGKSKTTVGGVAEGITSFAAGMVGALGILGKAGKLAKVGKLGSTAKKAEGVVKGSKAANWGKWTAAGAMADFAVFDAHEARLADLIQQFPTLENPITEYLASDMEDSELEGRLKNVAEGAALGGTIDLLAASLRFIRKGKDLRASGASPEEVMEGTAKERKKVVEEVQKNKTAKEAELEELVPKPKKEKAPDVEPEAPKAPKATAILKTLATKKKGEKSSVEQMLDDIANNPPEEALEKLLARFNEDGVLLNINSFTDDSKLSRESISLLEGLYDGILKTKKDFLLKPKQREAIVAELKENGFDESSDLFKGLSSQHELDAKFVSASATLRNHNKQLTENLLEYATLKEQIGKKTTPAEEGQLTRALNAARLKFIQHREQSAVLATALGAIRSQRGRDFGNLRWMDAAALKETEAVEEVLTNKLAIEDMTPDQLKTAMDKASAVIKKHGVAGLSKLGGGKGLIDIHNELWINALLSGPRTSAVNFIGNALTSVYLPLEKALGAQLSYWKTGNAQYITARNDLLRLTFFLDGLRESASLGITAFKEGDSLIQKRAAVTAELQGDAITSETFQGQDGILGWMGNYFGTGVDTAGKIIRVPTKMLTGADEFFKQMQFRYMAKAESAIKAHDQLLKKYGETPIPAEELATLTSDLMEGVIREGGERYSAAAVRRDGWEALQQAMKDNPDQEFDAFTQREFMREYFNTNFDKTKGAISDKAFGAAQEATFTRPQEGPMGQWIQNGVAKMPLFRLVMPFVSTPVNILKFFGQRTLPMDLPISRSLHKRYMDEFSSADPMVQAAARGRLAAGTALWSSAAALAFSGKLTGNGPERASERKILQETGWQPYSIKVGDKYISYQRLDPFATFFGMAADIAEYQRNIEHEDETILQTIVPALLIGVSQNVLKKSYMTGIQQIVDAASQPQQKLDAFLRTRISSYVPAVLGQAAGSMDGDDAIREARTVLEALKKKIPGAGDLDPRRNVLGEVVKQPNRVGPDYISPVVMTSRKKDAIMDEMAKAQHAFSMPSHKIQGGINLAEFRNNKGQSAYDRWMQLQGEVKIGGRTLRQQLTRLIQNKQFQNLSDAPEADFTSPRAKALKRIISKYRAYAKRKMLKEFPDLMKESSLVEEINFNRARGRDVEGLLEQLKGLR